MVNSLAANLDLALQLADEADRISLAHFQSADLVVETKLDMSPVTDVDRDRLRLVPKTGLSAELLALEQQGEMVVGVVSAPALGRRWWAARGLGAFADGRPMRVSAVSRLADAHVSLASLDSWLARELFPPLEEIARRVWSSTGFGDFWSHMLVAEGTADAALEPAGAIWDFAPLKVIVEQAGGRFTDFGGASTAGGGSGLSSNGGPIHTELLAIVGGSGRGL